MLVHGVKFGPDAPVYLDPCLAETELKRTCTCNVFIAMSPDSKRILNCALDRRLVAARGGFESGGVDLRAESSKNPKVTAELGIDMPTSCNL